MKELIPIQKGRKGKFCVPGSKSYTNRALLLASFGTGETTIQNGLESDDTKYMASALKELGVSMKKLNNEWKVSGKSGKFAATKKPLYLGNAGTAVRFLTAALAATNTPGTITGSDRMLERPISDLTDVLSQLGAEIRFHSKDGFLPLTIKKGITGGIAQLKGNTSSQYLSALLQALPLANQTSTIQISGKITSLPYIKMTLDTMKEFGVTISDSNKKKFTIQPSKYRPIKYTVESDASSATYPLAIAAINESEVTLMNLGKECQQADFQFIRVLEKMGCKTKVTKNSVTVKGPKNLKPLGTINLNQMPDAAMTVAIVCSFADGISKLTGIGNLRVKETDRLEALTNELRKIGVNIIEGKESLTIHGDKKKLHGNLIRTYEDHRMAMCFAVAGSRIPGITIINPECVSKTYPSFWKDIQKLGLKQKNVSKKIHKNTNLVLIGLRGSGKTSIGKLLAKKLNYKFVDTDTLIENRTGEKISAIVKKKGWKHFRRLEKDLAKEISTLERTVISTGGGMVMNPINASMLRKNGLCILLECSTENAIKRITNDKNRPRLTLERNLTDELKEVWKQRENTYRRLANLTIDTNSHLKNKTLELENNTKKILETLKDISSTSEKK